MARRRSSAPSSSFWARTLRRGLTSCLRIAVFAIMTHVGDDGNSEYGVEPIFQELVGQQAPSHEIPSMEGPSEVGYREDAKARV